MIGLIASLGAGASWPRVGGPSHRADGTVPRTCATQDRRATQAPRELPGAIQRALLFAGFASVALVALGNHAAAKIAELPTEMTAPSASQFRLPEKPVDKAEPAPLCRWSINRAARSFVARSSSATRRHSAHVRRSKRPRCRPHRATRHEVCTRRQLDEPLLHYRYRRIAGAFGAATSVNPVHAVEHRVAELRTRTSITSVTCSPTSATRSAGTPHASHHLWVNLPDPHPRSWRERLHRRPRCSTRYAEPAAVAAWSDGDQARLVEHVLGQLLFATRFGTTASCNDYTIHWDAPIDACERLAAEPIQFLDHEGASNGVRAVLDRRHRLIESRSPRKGARPGASGGTARCVVDRQLAMLHPRSTCRAVTDCRRPLWKQIKLDEDEIGLRESHIAAIRRHR